jgi:hypothetical protein
MSAIAAPPSLSSAKTPPAEASPLAMKNSSGVTIFPFDVSGTISLLQPSKQLTRNLSFSSSPPGYSV